MLWKENVQLESLSVLRTDSKENRAYFFQHAWSCQWEMSLTIKSTGWPKKIHKISCQVKQNEEKKESCSKDKKMLVISMHMWFLCISKCTNQLGQYKAHCSHYAKSFGTAVLLFFRVEISVVLTQEFNKLHFQECFRVKISSCICTFSGNTVSWTLVHNASVSRAAHFLVLLLLVVTVMYLFLTVAVVLGGKACELLESLAGGAGRTSSGAQSLKCHQTQIC